MESYLLEAAANSVSKSKLLQLRSCRSATDSKKTTELPEDIISEELLKRLPVETLLRFRSVCKSWESLFFTPNFIKAHFNCTINKLNSAYYDCLVASTKNGYAILSRDKETYIEPPKPTQLGDLQLVGSINGLVCLVSGETDFFLWNPIIGRYKHIPLPEKFSRRDIATGKGCRYIVGFGWDYLADDFQVVACSVSTHSRQGVVYSTNLGSWTELVIPDFVFRSKTSPGEVELMTPSTVVKECPYWGYFQLQLGQKPTIAVKFDTQTREFRLLPEFDLSLLRGNFNLLNVKNCLAVLVYRPWFQNKRVEVFLLDEERGVWNKMYAIRPIQYSLQAWRVLQGFRYGDEIVLQTGKNVICYDRKTLKTKGILGSNCLVISCFTYTASLVFLQGMKPVTI